MNVDIRALPEGQVLGEYEIERILGQGAFGITYLAKDVMLHRKYAIKEYYPREYAVRDSTLTVKAAGSKEDRDTYAWGLSRFLEEARILARFDDPNIIGVRRFFEANGTAYLVMDYCDGDSLDKIVKMSGPFDSGKLSKLVTPLLNGLSRVHAANFLHRDIKPANIFIRHDGSPVLLDFGAARQEVVSHSKSVTSLATPGYGAVEQYSTHGRQGPWTDIYGLGATLYRVVTGDKPQDSPGRMLNDELIPATIKAKGKYPEKVLQAIDAAMQVFPEKRPQTIEAWREMFDFSDAVGAKSQRKEPAFNSQLAGKEIQPTNDPVTSGSLEAQKHLMNVELHQPALEAPQQKSGTKRMVYAAIAITSLVYVVYLLLPSNKPSSASVKPTAVATDQPSKQLNFTPQNTFNDSHNTPGQQFTLFNRQLQMPRTDTPNPLNEAETRWCIYEGIRIGIIETKGKKNSPTQSDLSKFKSECSKRPPDESAKGKIPYELSDQELATLKGMKSL